MAERFVLDAGQPKARLDRTLTELIQGASRSTVQRWIREGRVLVNGKTARPKDEVGPGSVLEVDPGLPPPTSAEPDPSVEFRVLFEDEFLVVVDKPAGLVVHPARGHASGTLVNGLLSLPGFGRPPSDPRDREGQMRPGVVHRIDKDTSGILVVAKVEAAREGLKDQLAAHSVERVYRALTLGVPRDTTISTGYGRHPRSRLKFTSRIASERRAVTRVQVVERLAQARAALVECRLETGRTHQIRVHLSEQCGTPLLADALYGVPPKDAVLADIARELGRQALHAAVLGFVHPVTGSPLRFESPLPEDMQRALSRLRSA